MRAITTNIGQNLWTGKFGPEMLMLIVFKTRSTLHTIRILITVSLSKIIFIRGSIMEQSNRNGILTSLGHMSETLLSSKTGKFPTKD